MKIKFINALLGGDYSSLDIAVTVLATAINQTGQHKATVTDLAFNRRNWRTHLKNQIKRDKPDLIAMSTNTMYMQYVESVAREVKDGYGLPILLGGHHASRFPKETAQLPYCDWVLAGDCENTLPQFLDRLDQSREAFDDIPGVCYRKNNGQVYLNENASFIDDLNHAPLPDWDLWENLDKYFYFLQMLYVIGSRGCPYKCTYCDAVGIDKAVKGTYFRKRNPRLLAREIAAQWEKYKKRGFKLVQLFDPVFTIDGEWVREFCDEYRLLGLKNALGFSAFSRIDNLDAEKINTLGSSGCRILRVGIEAGDENIRNNIYKKKISNDTIREIFKQCRSCGIKFTAFYILGGPGETPDTMRKTINLARELNAERSAFFIYKPFTEEGERQIIEHGGWINKERWASADNITFGAVVESSGYTAALVERYQIEAYFWTFGRRLIKMLLRHPFLYFVRLIIYLAKGLFYGLNYRYLLVYYHIYSYDNVDR